MARMLMVAPDEALLKALRASPLLEGHAIEVAAGDAAAIRRLRQQAFDVLVTAPDTQPGGGHGHPRRGPARPPRGARSSSSRRTRRPSW